MYGTRTIGILLVLTLCSLGQAAVQVDGNLAEWGITQGSGGHLVYNGYNYIYPSQPPTSGKKDVADVSGFGKVFFHAEDSDDSLGLSALIGPNHGGQHFDGEFLGVAFRGDGLWIAIATGQRPDNGKAEFEPGDIRIETSAGVFGIETGGGEGNTSLHVKTVQTGDHGSTYNLNGSGYASSVTDLPGRAAGSLYSTQDSDWIVNNTPGSNNVRAQVQGGTYEGLIDYVYSASSGYNYHAFLEARVPYGDLGNALIKKVSWAPSCANDVLEYTWPEGQPPIPEPASAVVWSILAAAGFASLWWRGKSRGAA